MYRLLKNIIKMGQQDKPKLFKDFPPVSTQQWEDKIQEDLKGADYDKKLIWNTIDGFKVRAYYRLEDNKELEQTQALPGQFPYVRGKQFENNNWKIRQDIEDKNYINANKEALNAIEKGAEAIGLNVTGISNREQLADVINGINLNKISISFIHALNYKTLLEEFLKVLSNKNIDTEKVEGSFSFDPLGYFVLYGKFFHTQENNFNDAADLINKCKKHMPLYKVININGQHYHEAGATNVQEVAFSLAQANEYLAQLTDKNIPVDDITTRMLFNVSIGSSYFMEIAKIRALKMLWANIVKQYKPNSDKACQANIHALTSGWNKTIYDPYVNILRSTTEVMAASIGGVDSMTVNPFDTTFKKPDAFSKRLARNQQIIIKEESYFDKVADPAGGSYYIEQLTHSIASEAWKLFKEIESKGGFIEYSTNGFVKEEIEKICQKRDMNIAMRKQVFVGTNQYPNLQESMLDKIQPTAKLSDLGGLKPYRGAQYFEAIRLATENHRQKGFEIPKVFLFTYGNLTMRKARANFTTNFFGCAGYEIIDNTGFNTIKEGVDTAVRENSDIVVLCSSDEEYEEMAEAAKKIKEKAENTIVIVAGYPKELISKLREAGVDDFIHIKSNAIEVLNKYQELFQIN